VPVTEPKIIDRGLRFAGPLQKRTRTDYIVLHHAAVPSCTVESVHQYHLSKGWLGFGYHLLCRKDGTVYVGRPLDTIGAHCKDHNDRSVGVCAEGDYTKEQMPPAQEQALTDVVAWLLARYPGVAVKRHSDLNATACPGQNFPFDRIVVAAQESGTPILGPARATVEQAQAWARSRGAHQRFVDIASAYWKYGNIFGVRPEVLYSQAAKETAFGKYTGAVRPEQNNWAGIKTAKATGDRTEDHETFSTPEDGVRAHYNHMAAYVGLAPIGEVHGRYYVVKSLPWAGTIRYVEELGGKWAPNPDYGASIVRDYLDGLLATKPPEVEPPPPPVSTEALTEALEAEIAKLEARVQELEDMIHKIRHIVM